LGASSLNIGGGVGAIYHQLLASGARTAVHVDVSPGYLNAAREEAERRGHADSRLTVLSRIHSCI
jgi:23S rRNA G2069 N7-methylase RlmK/C1962 C5-methylase RlmI